MKRNLRQFNEQVAIWLEEVKLTHAPSTYVKYHQMAQKHIIPYFKGIALEEITNAKLKEYREYLSASRLKNGKERISDGMIRGLLMIVNTIMDHAFQNRLIQDAVHIHPGLRKKKTIVQVFSAEDQKTLEQYLRKHGSRSAFGIYLCLYTGLRLGELCALKWENVNLNEGYICVKRTVQRLSVDIKAEGKKSQLLLTPPKSESSTRIVPIPSFLLPSVREYASKALPAHFILTENADIPMEPRTLQYQYKRCLLQAGVPYLNFHALRHTFATRCITVGMDPKTLSEILGHSDIKITMDYYFHSSFEFKKNQIELLASFT